MDSFWINSGKHLELTFAEIILSFVRIQWAKVTRTGQLDEKWISVYSHLLWIIARHQLRQAKTIQKTANVAVNTRPTHVGIRLDVLG